MAERQTLKPDQPGLESYIRTCWLCDLGLTDLCELCEQFVMGIRISPTSQSGASRSSFSMNGSVYLAVQYGSLQPHGALELLACGYSDGGPEFYIGF